MTVEREGVFPARETAGRARVAALGRLLVWVQGSIPSNTENMNKTHYFRNRKGTN